jgi:TonB-linked SusC/RagA family outer membrane protein
MKNNSLWYSFAHANRLKKLIQTMKITIVLLFAFLVQTSASVFPQTPKLDLSVSNMKVKDVLRVIETKSKFRFFYNDDLAALNKEVSLSSNNVNLYDLLDRMFSGASITYKVFDSNVVVISPMTSQQQGTVTGTVTDVATGEALIGVSISVEGTTKGTITDASGKFSLDGVNSEMVLLFSYIGYVAERAIVGGQTNIDIKLVPDIRSLNDVVVIGYGTVKKKDLTGSVVSLKGTDITATPTNNVMEALQGKISGMDIMKPSGAVGSDVNILLRGTRTIYGDNTPLFIVDGMPANYNQINPSDIETIDVLKDASSTAIYGSAGSNGVVIITTKRGKDGKTKVNFDAYYGMSGNAFFKHGMTGDEYINYRREAYRTINGVYPENLSLIFNTPEYLQAYQDGKWIDWVKECMGGNTKQQKYTLSVAGGTQKTKVYTSFNIAKDEGLLNNENQTRYSTRLNLDQEIFKWAKVGTNLNLSYTNKNARSKSIFTKSLSAFPLGDAYDANGNINAVYISNPNLTTPLGDDIKDQYADNTKSTYVNANAYLEITPVQGLSFRSNLGTSINNSREGKYWGKMAVTNTIQPYAAPLSAIYNNYSYGYTWENILTYDKIIADNHHITVTGITSWGKNISDGNNLMAQGQNLDSYLFYNASSGTVKQGVTSNYQQKQSLSFAGRFNYSYKGKYLLTLTNRWDGVSHLAEGHKWDYFPSAAAAWRLSEEDFMEFTHNWLTNLKLRLGYGVTGNSGGMNPYDSQTKASTYQVVSIGNTAVANLQNTGTYANPSIGWEKSYNLNTGIDIGLFNNRIDIAIEVYNTDTKDLLFQRQLPVTSAITGWGSPLITWQNIGETNNKGYELTINTVNIQDKEFQWNSSISFTHNKEKIVSLPDGDIQSEHLFKGYPINTFYNYKYLGIWSTDEATEAALYGAQPGFVKVATNEIIATDGTSDGGKHIYSPTDRQILGSSNPKWILGFTNTFTYKGFDLGFFSMIRWGQMIQSDLTGWYDATTSNNQPAGSDYWTPEHQSAYFPRPGISSTLGIESLKYLDGSFVKIKNITLGYTLPQKVLKSIYMEKVRFYATAYNPIIFTKEKALKGTDPETNGSDNFPLFRTYVFGINIAF